MAIERQRYELNLRTALERQKVLMQEVNHRVKNSLQLVGSLFNLQARRTKDPELIQALQEAYARVTTVARVHERLYRNDEVGSVDLVAYLKEVCEGLKAVTTNNPINFNGSGTIRLSTDRAVLVALLMGELITNAAKHGYTGKEAGPIYVGIKPKTEGSAVLTVRDDGKGLPQDFEWTKPGGGSGLGMTIINAFVQQSNAVLEVRRLAVGTEFVVTVSLS